MGVSNTKATPGGRHLLQALLGRGRDCSPTGTPLPSLLHREVLREEICPGPGGRLLIVGDVHGCAQELHNLLKQEGFQKNHDTLAFVGDLVNKGPYSGEVVRVAREMGALCVRGNHEDELLEAWFRVGRFANGLEKYSHDTLYQVTEADVCWLQELPLSLSLPWLPLLVVHAGLLPQVPLGSQAYKDLLWMRDLRPASDSEGWQALESPSEGSSAWAEAWNGPAHVVFGHDAKRKLQVHPHATGLDSGCCYGFALSALVLDDPDDISTRRIAQVPSAKVYCAPKSA